ncbi:MAG: glycosyltransferase family 87 protein [Candidatus Omnitrophota bacterium]|jgi:hypothetical protein
MTFTTKRNIAYLLIAMSFIGLFFRYMHRAPKRHYCDFRVYYATAQRFAAKEDIYSRPDASITPFKYSPMFAFLVSPLSFLPEKSASLVFFTISFLSLIVICRISKKLILKKDTTFKEKVFFYFLPLVFTSRFILAALDSGQVTILILLLLICGIYFERKNENIISAALIALSFMFKYTSVILLPYFIFRKKIKLTILILLFTVIYCLVPALYVGMDKQKEYLKNWLPSISQTSLDKGSWYDTKNQSLYSLVLRTFTKDSPHSRQANLDFNHGLALAVILGAIIYIPILIPKAQVSENLDYSLLLICMALFNPNGWLSNFVFLLFGYMVIMYYLMQNGFLRNKTIAIVTFLSFVISSWGCESMVGDNLQNLLEMLSTVTIASLIVIFVLLKLKFSSNSKNSGFPV